METYPAKVFIWPAAHQVILEAVEARRTLLATVDALSHAVNSAIDIQLNAFGMALATAIDEAVKSVDGSADRNASDYSFKLASLRVVANLGSYTTLLRSSIQEIKSYEIAPDGVYDFDMEDLPGLDLTVKACGFERLVGQQSARLSKYNPATEVVVLVHTLDHPDRPQSEGYDAEFTCSYDLWLYGGPEQGADVTVADY